MGKGNLFIISGPSGTGKGTVCSCLVEQRDVYLSVSATTRDMRPGEEDGVTYHYKTRAEFEKLIADDKMLEWAEYNGNYYGTPTGYIDAELNSGRDVILEIEPQGAFKVRAKREEAVLIFIAPPSIAELRRRLKKRGREDDEQIEQRISAAKWELAQAEKYNYIVQNDDLDRCVADVSSIMDMTRDNIELVRRLITEI